MLRYLKIFKDTNLKIPKIFKDAGFAIDAETNLKIVDFLDITFYLHI